MIRKRPINVQPQQQPHPTVTVIVPAYNEAETIADTLRSILNQSRPAQQVIVVDDGSTDRTADIARSFAVTVLRPPTRCGSKARAQNFALPYVRCDLVLTVDADTVLAPTYLAQVVLAFADPSVAIAAGCVLSRFDRTLWERGRRVEYLFGFHFHRPVQNLTGAPVVCSGCCAAFRASTLQAIGGFPVRTIVEDMDLSWTFQRRGYRAVYVSTAVAYAADPSTFQFMRRQVWRWMSGFFQNVAIHWRHLPSEKPWLAVWVAAAILEIVLVPLWYGTCAYLTWRYGWRGFVGWAGIEFVLMAIPTLIGAWRRGIPLLQVLLDLPAVFVVKLLNFVLAWKAMVTELLLRRHLTVYEKGH